MIIGSHFGKHKPDWNFFLEKQRLLKDKYGLTIKFAFINFIVQAVLLFPILYWSLQNYAFFEQHVPAMYKLKYYITNEKMWIVFLYIVTLFTSSLVNFSLLLRALNHSFLNQQKLFEQSTQLHILQSSESAPSPDATADQHHAS